MATALTKNHFRSGHPHKCPRFSFHLRSRGCFRSGVISWKLRVRNICETIFFTFISRLLGSFVIICVLDILRQEALVSCQAPTFSSPLSPPIPVFTLGISLLTQPGDSPSAPVLAPSTCRSTWTTRLCSPRTSWRASCWPITWSCRPAIRPRTCTCSCTWRTWPLRTKNMPGT